MVEREAGKVVYDSVVCVVKWFNLWPVVERYSDKEKEPQ